MCILEFRWVHVRSYQVRVSFDEFDITIDSMFVRERVRYGYEVSKSHGTWKRDFSTVSSMCVKWCCCVAQCFVSFLLSTLWKVHITRWETANPNMPYAKDSHPTIFLIAYVEISDPHVSRSPQCPSGCQWIRALHHGTDDSNQHNNIDCECVECCQHCAVQRSSVVNLPVK